MFILSITVADPGFSVGGLEPPTQALLGGNVWENERIGSHLGGTRRQHPPGSATALGYHLTIH